MKTTLIILLTLIALSSKAQEYYEFAHNGHYGIVDADGQEIIPPTYLWKSYTLHHEAPFIALNSKNDGAVIIHTLTGKRERFIFLQDSYLTEIDGADYLYAYNDQEAFLMNNRDLHKRKTLPKRYQEVRQSGDFLIGYVSTEGAVNTVDILAKKDFAIKLSNQEIKQINDYSKATSGERIHAFVKANATVFYDENLKKITTAPKELKSFDEVKEFLRSSKNIEIADESYKMGEVGVRDLPDYPHIDTHKETDEDGYAVFNIFQSRNDFEPFFKFKWGENPNFRLTIDRYSNMIEAWNRTEHGNKLVFLFYTDVKQKKVLFPKKYWADIGLQLLTEQPELAVVELQTLEEAQGAVGYAPTGPAKAPNPNPNNNAIHTSVDIQAQYSEGTQALLQFFQNNFKLPEEPKPGKIYLEFVVERDGQLSDIKVLRDFGYGSHKEAIRVLKLTSSKWKPAIKDGKPVRSVFRLPIQIAVEPDEVEKQGQYNNKGEKTGEWKEYHENGQLKSIGQYESDKKTGEWRKYRDDGQLHVIGEFENGEENGEWKYYYKNGQLFSIGKYKHGEETGEWKEYYENGHFSSIGNYKKGKFEGEWK